MKPSSLSTFAIATFIFEAGIETLSCLEDTPLRMRVTMSAIGSVTFNAAPPPLPARLGHARYLPLERHVPEADAAHAEHTDVAARPAAESAAGALPVGKLRRPV